MAAEHVWVDLDTNTVTSPFNDADILPAELLHGLKDASKRVRSLGQHAAGRFDPRSRLRLPGLRSEQGLKVDDCFFANQNMLMCLLVWLWLHLVAVSPRYDGCLVLLRHDGCRATMAVSPRDVCSTSGGGQGLLQPSDTSNGGAVVRVSLGMLRKSCG